MNKLIWVALIIPIAIVGIYFGTAFISGMNTEIDTGGVSTNTFYIGDVPMTGMDGAYLKSVSEITMSDDYKKLGESQDDESQKRQAAIIVEAYKKTPIPSDARLISSRNQYIEGFTEVSEGNWEEGTEKIVYGNLMALSYIKEVKGE